MFLQQGINNPYPLQMDSSCNKTEYYILELQIHTFCTANGSLCSWSRYFSRLKKVSKNMWAILQRFKSPRVILPGENNIFTNICMCKVEIVKLNGSWCVFPIRRNNGWHQGWASTGTNLGSQVWPGRASGRVNPGRAEVRCPSFPSSHTVPHRNTPTQTWTGHHRHPCPCSGTSTLYWREKLQMATELHTIYRQKHRGRSAFSIIACDICLGFNIFIRHIQREKMFKGLSITQNQATVLPGGIFLVFFRYKEPDKLSVAHPAFSLHSVTPGNGRDGAIHVQYCHYFEIISSSVYVYMCVFPLTE